MERKNRLIKYCRRCGRRIRPSKVVEFCPDCRESLGIDLYDGYVLYRRKGYDAIK